MPPPNPTPNYGGGEKGKSGGRTDENGVALSLAIRDGERVKSEKNLTTAETIASRRREEKAAIK